MTFLDQPLCCGIFATYDIPCKTVPAPTYVPELLGLGFRAWVRQGTQVLQDRLHELFIPRGYSFTTKFHTHTTTAIRAWGVGDLGLGCD